MVQWIIDNKEWFFSGAGVFIISLIIGLFIKKGKSGHRQYQKSGDNSINYQAGADSSTNLQGQSIVIYHGITYADAKKIALDVYKSNFIELSKDAAKLATERAEEITDKFLEKLNKENKAAISSMNQPGMQIALYNAQKAYAATGDKDLESLLVNILVERAAEDKRTIKQITLDESLNVALKLTAEQFDALTVNFLISRTRHTVLVNLKSLINYLENYLFPFIGSLTFESSCYEHLEYAGCGSVMEAIVIDDIEHMYRERYPGLFIKGFTADEFKKQVGEIHDFQFILMECLHDPGKLQLNIMDKEVLTKRVKEKGLPEDAETKLIAIFERYRMTDQEVKDKIIELFPDIRKLFELWSQTKICKFTLTTVGIAIAQANLRRKQNITLDLSIWVK